MKRSCNAIGCLIITIILIICSFGFISMLPLLSKMGNSYSLGHKLHMIDWDGPCELIVYSPDDSGYGGIDVLPLKNEPFHIQDVDNVEYDDQWIIVRATNNETGELCFFIIDKSFSIEDVEKDYSKLDSIMQYYRHGPMNLLEFLDELKKRNIQLKF